MFSLFWWPQSLVWKNTAMSSHSAPRIQSGATIAAIELSAWSPGTRTGGMGSQSSYWPVRPRPRHSWYAERWKDNQYICAQNVKSKRSSGLKTRKWWQWRSLLVSVADHIPRMTVDPIRSLLRQPSGHFLACLDLISDALNSVYYCISFKCEPNPVFNGCLLSRSSYILRPMNQLSPSGIIWYWMRVVLLCARRCCVRVVLLCA